METRPLATACARVKCQQAHASFLPTPLPSASVRARHHSLMSTTPLTPFPLCFFSRAHSFSGGSHDDNTVGQGYKTAAAGGIVICCCNYIFVFMFGTAEEEVEGGPLKA